MSDVHKEVTEVKKQASSIEPIPKDKRIMSWGSNTMLWLGGCISIGTLAMGSSQLENGLNLLQLFLAVLIGSTILVVGITLNDQFGYTTGAPYAIQLRSAFGTKGNIGGTVIIIAMLYMLYVILTTQMDVIRTNFANLEGTWGMPFVAAIIAFFGNSTTVMLNASDYSREMKDGISEGARGVSYFLAMVPTTVLLGVIGAMASTATGIANPINAFTQIVDNKLVLIVTLSFIIFAQLSTNLASNVIPPAYAFMDVFKMKHKTAVIVVGILAVATCPWILTNDSSAAGLGVFVKIYSAFFAPIFGVLLTDYFILHKHNYTEEQLADLYNENGDHAGWNWAAIIAIAVGAVIGLLNIDIAFFTATIPSGLIFYLLMKYMPSCERFCKGTTLERK